MNDSLSLERLIDHSRELYSLPAVAVEVLALANDPLVDAAKLKECLERDPALVSKILRVVNSALFGLSRQVTDLSQAITLLGTRPLKLLVLGFTLPDVVSGETTGEALSRYWKHTLTKAVAAREISQRAWRNSGDDAFLAGLLADLGMLAMIQGLGQPYVQVVNRVRSAHRDLAAVEQRALGFDHTQFTVQLLDLWGFPPALVEAIKESGAPKQGPRAEPTDAPPLDEILRLAETLALLLAEEQTEMLSEALALGRRSHHLTDDELTALAAALEEKVGQLAEVLSLDLPDGLAYGDVLTEAHSQLARVAGDAASELLRIHGRTINRPADEQSLLNEVQSLKQAAANLCRKPATPTDNEIPAPTSDNSLASRTGTHTSHAASAMPPAPVVKLVATQKGSSTPAPAARTDLPREADELLLARLTSAVAVCRQSRCPLSLLLVEADHPDEWARACGQPTATRWLGQIETTCRQLDIPSKLCLSFAPGRLALILANCEREQVVDLGNQLLRQIRALQQPSRQPAVTASLGAATLPLAPRNFDARQLLDSARRCLHAAQVSGNSLKSIEII
jgi:HD-like signal output (HDOD) protein/GGDEF domain-containing protein